MDEANLPQGYAEAIMSACLEGKIMSLDGAVDLRVKKVDIANVLEQHSVITQLPLYKAKKELILDIILKSRYRNLQSLLQDHVSEETYMGIVSNQILVDVQGEDLLYQIFTSNILQRRVGDEAPFLEFIQRVCSERLDETGHPAKMKPGCGGFG